jgi:hypothetical protein
MRYLISKILRFLNQPTYRIGLVSFIVMIIIGWIYYMSPKPIIMIVIGAIIGIIQLGYLLTTMKEDGDKISVYMNVIGVLFSIFIITAGYLELKNISLGKLVIALPILLFLLFWAGYKNVEKSGDMQRIRQAKSELLIAVLITLIVLVILVLLFV